MKLGEIEVVRLACTIWPSGHLPVCADECFSAQHGGESLQGLVRLLLRPVMIGWRLCLGGSFASIPHPIDAPQAHGDGVDAYRVLVLGNGAAFGWGVLSHELALPGQLARELARVSGRGVDVDLVLCTNSGSISRVAAEIRAWRYEAIIVICGIDEVIRLERPKRWCALMHGILQALLAESATSTEIVVMGMQPIRSIPGYDSPLGRVAEVHGRTLNRITERLCAGFSRVSYLPLPTPVRSSNVDHRSPAHFHDWAVDMVEHLAPRLPPTQASSSNICPSPAELRNRPEDEQARQQAVDELHILDTPPDEYLNRIARLAKEAFGTSAAMITIIDEHRQWHKANIGVPMTQTPRAFSACDIAIRHAGITVVADTSKDPRFRHIPGIRFYAGYPIESPNGYRVGTLCVLDSKPRIPPAIDEVLLRRLAMMAQQRLWQHQRQTEQHAS